ncbi:MAG: hypothetical protein KU29_13770 [Sulfurovum sp. FS06-10]|nr:MAG: hypothetical protein KU29_13770 [Sulfurovum sp. FS06-10]
MHIISIAPKCRLIPVIRTKTELFSETVSNAQKKYNLDVIINGPMCNVTWGGVGHALINDEAEASATTNIGYALFENTLHGSTSPDMFYIAQKKDYSWVAGFGNLPNDSTFYSGMGGLSPLIINGMRYGKGNMYNRKLDDANYSGEPKPEHKQFLIQRNNNTYRDLDTQNTKQKAGIGITGDGRVFIILQDPHIMYVTGHDAFRDTFVRYGCVSALAVDGSDSIFLNLCGNFKMKAGSSKNSLQTFGLGFRHDGTK